MSLQNFHFVAAALAFAAMGMAQTPLGGGLASLPQLRPNVETRMVSPENPTGEKGKGAMAIPNPADPDLAFSNAALDLGQGWKVRPFVKVPAHQTVTMMNVEGPGIIQHIWMATAPGWQGNGRASVLRFYWDNEETPSVETPLTDFFAVGHEMFARVNSLAVIVNPKSAMNCYWPMPFRKHSRITFTNDSEEEVKLLTWQIDFQKTEVSRDTGYFHAQWRRAVTERSHPEYTILDGVRGEGQYVGTFLAWIQHSDGWFGEGEVKFFLDGDKQFPTLAGTGTEDYFGASYGFPETYTTPYIGCTLDYKGPIGPPKWSMYRWHIQDPVVFHKDLKITIQALGWLPNNRYEPLSDDIASVAYWYQREPHAPFPKFPSLSVRWMSRQRM